LTVSLSEDDFTIKKQDLTESVQNKQSKKYNKMLDSMPEDTGAVLSLLQEQLADVEDRISALELQLNDLRALKQLILNRLHKIGMDSFEQDERRIIYKIIEESPRSIAELSKIMGEKESDLKGVIKEIRNRMDIKRTQVLFENLK
jgi:DNA-directed RNA polymerase subunit F